MMRTILKHKKIIGAAALIALGAVAYHIAVIRRDAVNALAESRVRLAHGETVAFEKKFLTPHRSKNFQIKQNYDDTRDLTRFRGAYFAATGGGLAEYADDGALTRHYTVADGLPESDLTCLLSWRGKLYIGTRTKNLLVFDGENFERFVWTDRQVQTVTALAQRGGRLLIGTFAGGLLEFDGANFTEIKADTRRIRAVNCLFADERQLIVGSFDDGLWIYKADVWRHLTTADHLPSNRVVSVARMADDKIYAATDFGLAVIEDNLPRPLAVLPALTGAAAFSDRLFLTGNDGEIYIFDGTLKKTAAAAAHRNSRLVTVENKLFLASERGIFSISGGKITRFNRADADALTDNFVSALAVDRSGDLWVGTFRRGIDVFSADGAKIRHLESDALREINFLNAGGDSVSAATSGGRHTFSANFSARVTNRKNGLPSDSVTHFSGDWTATTNGLALVENDQPRVLSTINGLPGNSVYATLAANCKIYVGTLGGLAEIQSKRVVRTYTDANSNLRANWITALTAADDRIFIGTYGGGIFELLASGDIRSFEPDAGKFVVNPNALYSDGARLYAGTLAGVKILDLKTQKWTTLAEILPAENVLSVAGGADGCLYFGTSAGIARVEKSYFESGELP